jgi:hypothetical protein
MAIPFKNAPVQYGPQNQKKTLANSQGHTLWLKHKIVKRKDGTEKEVFQGSVDIGGGKMVKISIDARLYTVELENKGTMTHALPAYVSKWKSEPRLQQTNKNSW